jgi:hypothetical protein
MAAVVTGVVVMAAEVMAAMHMATTGVTEHSGPGSPIPWMCSHETRQAAARQPL